MGNMTEFLVTPEVLLQSAERMEASVKKAKTPVSRLEKLEKGTERCLKGKTGEAFRAEAAGVTENWRQQIEKLAGIAAELKEIADTYKEAEGENSDVVYGIAN